MGLSNEQYNLIMDVYGERAFARERELARRRETVFERLPRVRQIEEEIRSVAISEARRRISEGIKDTGASEGNRDSLYFGMQKNGGGDVADSVGVSPDGMQGSSGGLQGSSDGMQGSSGGMQGSPDASQGSFGASQRRMEPSPAILRIERLRQEKSALMEKAGFGAEYLDPPYICPDCRDTGYVNGRHCHCYQQLSLELFGDSRSQSIYERSLKDFSLDYYPGDFIDGESGRTSRELAVSALERARDFVERFDESFENILLIGKTGTGKTHLSGCIGGELLSRGRTVCYLTAFELFSSMKKEAFSRESYRGEDYERIFGCDLLIIDDLGTEFPTAMTNSWLFELVNERIRRRVSTLISTNLDLGGLGETYTERMISRFVEHYTAIKLAGPDIRILKKGIRGGRS